MSPTNIYDRAAQLYKHDAMRNAYPYPDIEAAKIKANIDAGGIQAQLKYLEHEISCLTEVIDVLSNKLAMVTNPSVRQDAISEKEGSARSELACHLQGLKNRVASNVQRIREINEGLDL